MANETITSGAGLRNSRVYALNTSGIPDGDQSGANGYDGLDVQGIKAVTINVAENQTVTHTGDDYAFAQDFLPPNTLPSGSFTTGKANQTLDTTLNSTLVDTIGEWTMDGMDTDKSGQEIDVCFTYQRQALVTDEADSDFGSRRWQNFFISKCRITPQGNNPGQGADDVNNYQMTPTPTLQSPWGVDFTTVDNGFLRAVRLRVFSEKPLYMERYTGNGTLTTFNTVKTPITVAKTQVFGNGTPLTVNSVSTGSKTFTLSAAPANNVEIVALYEHSDTP